MSTGDILRRNVNENTSLGQQAKDYMNKGELVPDKLVIDMIDDKHKDNIKNGNKPLLLDGFPRSIEQAMKLDEILDIGCVLCLDVPHETIIQRLSSRWIHNSSGRVYNLDYNPPIKNGYDDVTNEPLVQREDDKPHVISKRLQGYEEMTKPLLSYYTNSRSNNKTVPVKLFQGTESDVIYPNIYKYLMNK